MPDALGLAALILLGSWSALDATAVGQILISRPLVSASLAGWLIGDPGSGMLVGILLEGAHLGELPIGGARIREPGLGGVPAAAAVVWIGGAGGLALGAALGIAWSALGGWSVTLQRRLNGILTEPPRQGWRSSGQLSLRHWACIATDGLRGAFLTAAGLAVATRLTPSLGARWPLGFATTVALLSMPALLAGGALVRAWGVSGRRAILLAAGCGAGLLVALLP